MLLAEDMGAFLDEVVADCLIVVDFLRPFCSSSSFCFDMFFSNIARKLFTLEPPSNKLLLRNYSKIGSLIEH